jgi:hypothetical protein
MIYPNMFECRTWLIFAQVPERNKRNINVVYGLVWVNCGYNLWDSYGFSETRFSCDSQYMGFVGEKYGTNSAQWEKTRWNSDKNTLCQEFQAEIRKMSSQNTVHKFLAGNSRSRQCPARNVGIPSEIGLDYRTHAIRQLSFVGVSGVLGTNSVHSGERMFALHENNVFFHPAANPKRSLSKIYVYIYIFILYLHNAISIGTQKISVC